MWVIRWRIPGRRQVQRERHQRRPIDLRARRRSDIVTSNPFLENPRCVRARHSARFQLACDETLRGGSDDHRPYDPSDFVGECHGMTICRFCGAFMPSIHDGAVTALHRVSAVNALVTSNRRITAAPRLLIRASHVFPPVPDCKN